MGKAAQAIAALAVVSVASVTRVASAQTESAAPEPATNERFGAGVLGGVGFPRPLSVEGIARFGRTFAVGAEYSAMPKLTIDGVDTRFWAVAGDARVFPFRNAFFLGMRAGRQRIDASTTIAIPRVGSFAESLAIESWFINPRVGFLFTWKPIALELAAGVQIPIGASTSSTLPPNMQSLVLDQTTAGQMARQLGTGAVPTIDLLRLGVFL